SALFCLLMPIITFARSVAPLHIVRGFPIVEEVYINSSGPYHFLLDTGAQSSAIRPDLAAKLNLRPAYQVQLVTTGGSRPIAATIADRVSLGSQSVERVELDVHELTGIRCVDRHIQGVLAENFLSHFNYLLDYKNRRLVLADTTPSGDRVRFERIDQRPA